MAIWTTPKTWYPNDIVTASEMNTYIRDNTLALKNPPMAVVTVGGKTTDYSTTSTSFVAIDSTVFKLSITTAGGDVLIWFTGMAGWASAIRAFLFDVEMDGTRLGGTNGLWGEIGDSNPKGVGFVWRATSVPAGSHTFELVWRTTDSAMTLYLRVSTASGYKAQFGVVEVGT